MRRIAHLLPLVALLVAAACRTTVAIPANQYGLPVVGDARLYRALAGRDPEQVLVPVADLAPGVRLEIRYATVNNFMGEVLYPAPAAFLRCAPARSLAAAQRELEVRGLGLKVFDAYRPYAVTMRMWEKWKDPDYVADPAKGSRHNRGAAVDVTLVDLTTGRELEMPTPYDDFTPAAASDYAGVTPAAAANRAILHEVMERHGFTVLRSEWWHFDYEGWERYPLMDLPHAALTPPPARCP